MAERIVMPSFGMYTAEGQLVAWLYPDGATVEAGQPVLEIETQKATESVIAPVAVVTTAGAHTSGPAGPGLGLAAFNLPPEAIAEIAVGTTMVLAFCEGIRRLFQFDHRWRICVETRENLRWLRLAVC